MATKIRSALSQVQYLLDSQQYHQALSELEQIVVGSVLDRAKVRILRTSAFIGIGTFDLCDIELALDELRLIGDNEWFPFAKYLRARILTQLGSLAEASEEARESYVYYRRNMDEVGMGDSANLLSYVAFQQSDYATAIPFARRAIGHYSAAQRMQQVESVRLNLVTIELRCGQLARALQTLDSLPMEHVLSMPPHKRFNYYHRAALAEALLFRFDDAKKFLSKAEILPPDLRREHCHQLEIAGLVHSLCGEYAIAEGALIEGEKLAFDIAPDSALVSQIKRLFGDLYILTGKFDLAEKYATEGLAVAEKINERLEIAACYRVLAQVESHRGNGAKAREWYKKAIDLFGLISARYELAVTRYLAACSGLYEQSERIAMLYLAKEYFESEEVAPYIEKVSAELATLSTPKSAHPITKAQSPGGITVIAVSNAMRKILEKVSYIAPSDMNVLLTGETGTGKDLLAEYVHTQSGRKGKFISVNVAALPSELMESELFGHSKGAFTNARTEKPGLMQEAHEGTLFLNEIGEAPLELQAKLLQVIETRKVRRLGETTERVVNFRLIAATNQDLAERIREGKFRSDLYHRLNQAPIALPSLRERPEEMSPLVTHFLANEGCEITSGNGELSELTRVLSDRAWPGNVRELASTIKRLWVMSGHDLARMILLAAEEVEQLGELDGLEAALVESGGNQRAAARRLGIDESTLRYHLKKRGQ